MIQMYTVGREIGLRNMIWPSRCLIRDCSRRVVWVCRIWTGGVSEWTFPWDPVTAWIGSWLHTRRVSALQDLDLQTARHVSTHNGSQRSPKRWSARNVPTSGTTVSNLAGTYHQLSFGNLFTVTHYQQVLVHLAPDKSFAKFNTLRSENMAATLQTALSSIWPFKENIVPRLKFMIKPLVDVNARHCAGDKHNPFLIKWLAGSASKYVINRLEWVNSGQFWSGQKLLIEFSFFSFQFSKMYKKRN